MIPDPKRPGKTKKVKKQIPAYIPEQDAMILAKMRKRSYSLDMALFDLFGIRFGWSALLGLIPGFGDLLDAFLALMLVKQCAKVSCGLDSSTQSQMYMNVIIDLVVGFVPLLGDLADAAFKANTRNVRLLEKRLDAVYKPDSARNEEKARRKNGYPEAPATVYEDFGDEEDERRAFIRQQDGAADRVQRPQPAQKKTGGGWFSGSRRNRDVEMGQVRDDDQETGTVVGSGRR